jgi:hypothetical protein
MDTRAPRRSGDPPTRTSLRHDRQCLGVDYRWYSTGIPPTRQNVLHRKIRAAGSRAATTQPAADQDSAQGRQGRCICARPITAVATAGRAMHGPVDTSMSHMSFRCIIRGRIA